jgi:hypothetical protein
MKKCCLLQRIHYIKEINFCKKFYPFTLGNYLAIAVYSPWFFLLPDVKYEQVNYFTCLLHYIKHMSQTRSYRKSRQFFIGLSHIQLLLCCLDYINKTQNSYTSIDHQTFILSIQILTSHQHRVQQKNYWVVFIALHNF